MSTLRTIPYQRIQQIQILTQHLAEDWMAGAYRSAFKGKGMEFEEVREYVPGDEVRHIDWNVTARMQHPYIKTFKEEREITLVLLVDISSSTLFGTGSTRKREYIAEVAAALAFSAVRNQDKVALVLFSDRVEKALPAKKGIKHAMQILHEIMTYVPREKSESDPTEAILFFGQHYKKATLAFILSDFLFEPKPHLYANISAKHDLIAVMTSDPAEKLFPAKTGSFLLEDPETGKTFTLDGSTETQLPLQQIWQAQTKALSQAGASIIQLDTHKPYYNALRQFFRLRSRRH